nr:homeobox-leucine zipper protein HAT22-like isoform X1 [Tanacetum cinerariifolium]
FVDTVGLLLCWDANQGKQDKKVELRELGSQHDAKCRHLLEELRIDKESLHLLRTTEGADESERATKTKLKHIEQEYEWLKKCFQRLKDENSRLKKELQEVACFSLKADNHQPLPQLPLPFYIRYPTTTMMMHNLCHKIGKSKEITKVAVVNGGNMGQILHDDSNNKNAFVSKLL